MDAEGSSGDALDQAAEWQIRLLEDPRVHDEFQRWLAADAAHREAWLRMRQLWNALESVTPPVDLADNIPVKASTAPRRRTARRCKQLALACAMAGLAILLGPRVSLYLQSDYRTGVAESREVVLSDGSRITLGADSAIRVVQDSQRRVELLKGQAYFQVAPDPARPFVARAGDLAVSVLGTAFDLEMDRDGTEVALEHGQVQAENATRSRGLKISERLLPGDRLRVDWQAGTVQRSRMDPRQVAAWRAHSLYVEDLAVSDIVARLERHTGGWILVPDEQLRQRRISGVFDLRDPGRALTALAEALNVPARRIAPGLSLLGNL